MVKYLQDLRGYLDVNNFMRSTRILNVSLKKNEELKHDVS